MTPQQQADAIGRLRGNLSAEVVKAAATGGVAAGTRAVIVRVGVRIEGAAAAGVVAGEAAETTAVRNLIDDAARREPVNVPNVVRVDAANAGRGTPGFDTLNRPPPNSRIELSNGTVYTTNSAGIVDDVTFQPRLVTEVRDKRQKAVGRQGLDTDVGGHIQACSLGVTCDRVNLFPQDANFNNSAYKVFENEIRRALEAEARGGPKVGEVKVKFVRDTPGNPRPTRVEVTYVIGGKPTTIKFRNQSGG